MCKFASAYTEKDVELDRTPKYTITCYATADGYDQSETVTKEIEIQPGDVDGDGEITVTDLSQMVNKILKK